QQSYQYVKVSSLTSNTEHDADIHSNSKEKDFLVRLKNDPDQFGSRHDTEILDEGDLQEEKTTKSVTKAKYKTIWGENKKVNSRSVKRELYFQSNSGELVVELAILKKHLNCIMT
ncbi:hypothetical protein NQ317_017972, partial [Molorchus minor]